MNRDTRGKKKRRRPEIPLLPLMGLPEVGRKYHVSWGYHKGVVGKCISIDAAAKTVILQTPKTKKLFKNPVLFEDLRYIRSNEPPQTPHQ
jgi:hypothetical protein